MRYRGAILTDIDNTIFDWVGYFGPSFRAMVHALARELNLPENELVADFKNIYTTYGSVEYAYSVQKLTVCDSLPTERILELAKIAKGAFSRVRAKYLRPYEGVKETLQWAREQGIAVVAVTNSAVFQAQRRLWQLHLDGFFAGLAAWEGSGAPADDDRVGIAVVQGGAKWSSRIERVWPVPSEHLKPNSEMYAEILNDLGVDVSLAWVVGDSLEKDVKPAMDIGAKGIWAKYGTRFSEKDFQTLLSVTNWDQKRIATTYAADKVRPDMAIEDFRELMELIPPIQPVFMWPR